MVVDDEPMLRLNFMAILEDAGHTSQMRAQQMKPWRCWRTAVSRVSW